MTDSDFQSRSAPWISGLFVVMAAALLVFASPMLRMHLERLRDALASGPAAGAAALLALAFILFLEGVRRSPRTTAAATGTVLFLFIVWTGNLLAFTIAAALLALTLLAGDTLARLLRGVEAGSGELSVSIAAGCGVIGLGLLLLGEIHHVRLLWLIAAAAAAALALAVPTQLLSAPRDLNLALRRATPETALAALPAFPLWSHVRSEDRVLLLGDPDRFHCPARVVVNDMLVFPGPEVDPARWQREWRPLGITHILHREDRRNAAALLRVLGNCVHVVASHNVATLYRVDGPGQDCSVDRVSSPGPHQIESKQADAHPAGDAAGEATRQ